MTGHTKKVEDEKPLNQTSASAILGVSREHLNRVINGHRVSKSLTARYAELVQSRKPKDPSE